MGSDGGSFRKNFKKYDESKTYEEFEDQTIAFNSEFLQVADVNDIRKVMEELNALSYKLYYYGYLSDAQARVVQQLEDEFEKWKAVKLHEEKIDDKQYKNEKSKERYLSNKYSNEYTGFTRNLADEKYKLSLLSRVVSSLTSFGYKLHDLKDYNMTIGRNS